MVEREQVAGQAQPVEQFEGVGVEGVAAEVAVEVRARFEHGDLDPGAGEQVAEQQPAGAAAGDRDAHRASTVDRRNTAMPGRCSRICAGVASWATGNARIAHGTDIAAR